MMQPTAEALLAECARLLRLRRIRYVAGIGYVLHGGEQNELVGITLREVLEQSIARDTGPTTAVDAASR